MVILTASGKWEPFQEKEMEKQKKKRQKLQHVKQKEISEALEMEAAVTSSPLTFRFSQTIVLDSDPEDSLPTTPPHNRSSFNEGSYNILYAWYANLNAYMSSRLEHIQGCVKID